MNEKKSVKLHKSHKIVCFIVCFIIVFAITIIPSFALDGVYTPFVYCGNDFLSYVDTNDAEVVINASGTYTLALDGEVGEVPFTSIMVYSDDNEFTFSIYSPVSADGSYIWFPIYSAIGEAPFDNGAWAFPGYTCLNITSSFGISNPSVAEWFDTYFTQPPIYDGNPWVDILNGVLTALDVNIFGTFSYLDVVSTLAGACLAIWLLKMLAGG